MIYKVIPKGYKHIVRVKIYTDEKAWKKEIRDLIWSIIRDTPVDHMILDSVDIAWKKNNLLSLRS